ncbi:hypothetical protein [Vibrio mexicanus]|uniref:hypothetical protein n=1 Tax=Vibrio mexicanus TaxID=1004326 RepID=UPI00063C5BED|nr:hypothetical protein [Vibrio mexicanus]
MKITQALLLVTLTASSTAALSSETEKSKGSLTESEILILKASCYAKLKLAEQTVPEAIIVGKSKNHTSPMRKDLEICRRLISQAENGET